VRNLARREVVELSRATEYAKEISALTVGEQYGLDPAQIVDLSLNVNVFGPPAAAMEAVRAAIPRLYQYPDVALRKLKRGIADLHGLTPDRVFLGDGLDEVLKLIAQSFVAPGDEVIIPIPTFPRYELEVRIMGGRVRQVPLTGRFEVPVEEVLAQVSDRTKLVFLCSPNNPTGAGVSRETIVQLLELGEEGPLVVVDEAVIFPADPGVADLAPGHANLMVLRTFSKYFGLAGARVGYAIADPSLLAYMDIVRPPFNVNLLGEAAALGALEDRAFLEQTRSVIAAERQALLAALSRLPGVRPWPSEATIMLIDVSGTGMTSTEVTQGLLPEGVIVVDCRSYAGLEDRDYLRISIGRPEGNRRFVAALERLLKTHSPLGAEAEP
jgi:histidinol-phosphate aminotransferase